MKRAFGGLLLAVLFAPSVVRAAEGAYDLFPTAMTGTARSVALGGATIAADPDGYEAVFANPAGLSGMAGTGIDFGSDGNGVDNFVVDLNQPKSRSLNVPIKYSYAGVRYVTDSGWGVGFAASTPFDYEDTFNGATRVVRRKSAFVATNDLNDVHTRADAYTLAAGRGFLDGKLGVGAALVYTRAKTSYAFTPIAASSAAFARGVSNDAYSADFGLMGAPYKWLRAGVTYKMGYRIPFGAANNNGLPVAFTAFRDVKTPDRVLFGLRLAPYDNLRFFAQGRVIFGMKGTLVSGSDVFPGATGATVASGRTTTLDGGWGAEYVPYDVDDLTVKMWAGGYFENTGIEGTYTRYHRTAGFSFAPWFLSFNMAIDDAELYDNFVVGLGVDLLQVGKRLSKTYGWNLPL